MFCYLTLLEEVQRLKLCPMDDDDTANATRLSFSSSKTNLRDDEGSTDDNNNNNNNNGHGSLTNSDNGNNASSGIKLPDGEDLISFDTSENHITPDVNTKANGMVGDTHEKSNRD